MNPYYGFNQVFAKAGWTELSKVLWLGNPKIALFAVAFVDNWHWWGDVYKRQQYAWEDAQPLFDALGIPERNGIHYREGGHAHNEEDWQALLTYLNFYYFGKPLTDDINQKRFAR